MGRVVFDLMEKGLTPPPLCRYSRLPIGHLDFNMEEYTVDITTVRDSGIAKLWSRLQRAVLILP